VFLRDVREFPFDAVTTLCSAASQPQHHTLLHHDSIRTSQYTDVAFPDQSVLFFGLRRL
jgi:hypothetical protein